MSQNVKFEQIVKIVNEFSALGESKGLGKLYTEDEILDGRIIGLKGKKFINFGSCSYLGLELDPRLKEAAIEAIYKYGTYFSCSRIYVSCGNYSELEHLLSKIFKTNILLTTNSTLGHHSVMPIVIGTNDMVIYDQQAHVSMHELSYKLNHYGTGISILRHNRLDELEQKIEQYKSQYDKIWYVIDGVYSMFGDLAPTKDIINLLDKHKKLWLYVDDAHGMSWAGPNGSGYTLSQTSFHPKMVMGTSMAKGFGSCGGIFLFHDVEMRNKVKRWGGPLAYSGPQEPATVAAAIASAKIHLSGEIYDLQKCLHEKISYCNQLMEKHRIPLVSVSQSGIFFVACGLPLVGFELVERLMDEGFYTNIGIFPAVPETCTGVRFTMTNHITFEDIERLVKAISFHYPKALKKHNRSMADVYKAFRKFSDFESRFGPANTFVYETESEIEKDKTTKLKLAHHKTIKETDPNVWNTMMGNRGSFDYNNLVILEQSFTGNNERENNWDFNYYLIYEENTIVAATFFTTAMIKDDMLSPEKISAQVEEARKSNPYYLTSYSMMMGTLLTNGNHLYVDKTNAQWEEALTMILDAVWLEQENNKANSLYLRDFDLDDVELTSFFIHHGFIKIDNLENNIISNINTYSFEEFFEKRLSSKKRYQIKHEALSKKDEYVLKIDAENVDIETLYKLYYNVKQTNLSLNTFTLPRKIFENIKKSSNWEIITLHNKDNDSVVGMSLCLKTTKNYSHVIFGVDSLIDKGEGIYKLMIYHVVKRAFELKSENLYMGITASDTKRKFGAEQKKQVAFVQIKDKFNQEFIDSLAFQ